MNSDIRAAAERLRQHKAHPDSKTSPYAYKRMGGHGIDVDKIAGRSGAAQQALDCADDYGGEVRFWRLAGTIFVERVEDVEANHLDPEFWK